jgi:hypothetical protein
MKDKNYEEMVRRAEKAVDGVDEPLKSVAFKEILNDLMRESAEPPKVREATQLEVEERKDKAGEFLLIHSIQTLNQLERLLKPISHVDRVLMIAYFLREERSLRLFQTKDIEACYQEALIRPSSNTSQMINQNKKKGFIMDVKDEDGEIWKGITHEGIEEMERKIKEALNEKD